MRRLSIRTWIILGLVLLVLPFLGGLVWLLMPQPLLPEATAALHTTAQVVFAEENGYLSFTPAQITPTVGFIFYPGGKVPAAAYAPGMAAIAAQGYAAFIVPMPLNLAFTNVEGAAQVQAAHPEIKAWAIGGHSLGGSMAAEYAARHPGQLQGLVFWASYSAADLSAQALQVVSIYGTLEGGRTSFTDPVNVALLPAGIVWVPITGGNHEQFGYYTGQLNDPPATIARTDQQAQAVAATVALLGRLEEEVRREK